MASVLSGGAEEEEGRRGEVVIWMRSHLRDHSPHRSDLGRTRSNSWLQRLPPVVERKERVKASP